MRKLNGGRGAGINRVWWDLRYERTKEPELRTTPPSNPHIWEEKRFKGHDTRGIYHYGIEEPKLGPFGRAGNLYGEAVFWRTGTDQKDCR